MREEEDETEPSFYTLKFPLLPLPPPTVHSPEHPSGMATPPLHALASVPFKWEEEPGKPRPCTDIIALPGPAKCLELPPCRNRLELTNSRITKMPSPTTVLDGPYNLGRPKCSSFRFFRESHRSFDSSSSSGGGGGGSPQSSVDFLLGKKNGGRRKTRGFLSRALRLTKSGKREVDGGSLRFSPSSATGCDGDGDGRCYKLEGKMRRNGSFSSLSQAASTHLWVSS